MYWWPSTWFSDADPTNPDRFLRSPKWPAVRDAWLKGHPTCAACGEKVGVEVHHVQPFHTHQAMELDPANFMSLCRPHHLLVGHLMSWRSVNSSSRADAAAWLAKVRGRP